MLNEIEYIYNTLVHTIYIVGFPTKNIHIKVQLNLSYEKYRNTNKLDVVKNHVFH